MPLDLSAVPSLTREQAAIIGLFTGVTVGPFEDVQELAERYWPGIGTVGMASLGRWEREARLRPLLLGICAER